MTQAARMGWLDRIVDVQWGNQFYFLLDLQVDANSPHNPSVSLSTEQGVKTVYLRNKKLDHGSKKQITSVVWLPQQAIPIHDDNPQDQFVPCVGHFTYYTGSIAVPVGYADVDTAYAHMAQYNGIGGWFNSTLHPSAKASAFIGVANDIVTYGPPFSTLGGEFTPAKAAAFAAALNTMSTPGGGWANGPIPASPVGFPSPCWQVDGPQPHEPPWFSTWQVGTKTLTSPANYQLEYVRLLAVPIPAGGKRKKVFEAKMSGSAGWNTFLYSYKKKGHKVDTGFTGASPYGAPDGKVWYPINPYLDFLAQSDMDAAGTREVYVDHTGQITVL